MPKLTEVAKLDKARAGYDAMQRLAVHLFAALDEAAELCDRLAEQTGCECSLLSWEYDDHECRNCAIRRVAQGMPFALGLLRGAIRGEVSCDEAEVEAIVDRRRSEWEEDDAG